MHTVEKKLLANLRTYRLMERCAKGLVCVSGGADSTALLHGLVGLHKRMGLSLEVLHFDHGLREDSGREAEWVRARAKALN